MLTQKHILTTMLCYGAGISKVQLRHRFAGERLGSEPLEQGTTDNGNRGSARNSAQHLDFSRGLLLQVSRRLQVIRRLQAFHITCHTRSLTARE